MDSRGSQLPRRMAVKTELLGKALLPRGLAEVSATFFHVAAPLLRYDLPTAAAA